MSEDYSKEQDGIKKELGTQADPLLVAELVETISTKWELPAETPKQPVLLLMGGFQGAGKSSVTDDITTKLPLVTVSSDEIRHYLFQKIPFSEILFVHTVNATGNRLIERALETKQHVVVDLFCTKPRIELFRRLTKDTSYKVITVYLNASQHTLIRRIEDRPTQTGRYKGTLAQLIADFEEYGEPDKSIYDLVLESEQTTITEISRVILDKIKILQK